MRLSYWIAGITCPSRPLPTQRIVSAQGIGEGGAVKGLPILGRAGVSPPEGYQSRFALGLFPRPWIFPGFGGRGYPLPYHKAHLMGRGLWEGSRTIRACAYSSQPRACPQRSQNFWYSRSKVIWQRGQTGKVFPSRNRKTWVTGIGLRKDFAEARSGFCRKTILYSRLRGSGHRKWILEFCLQRICNDVQFPDGWICLPLFNQVQIGRRNFAF